MMFNRSYLGAGGSQRDTSLEDKMHKKSQNNKTLTFFGAQSDK